MKLIMTKLGRRILNQNNSSVGNNNNENPESNGGFQTKEKATLVRVKLIGKKKLVCNQCNSPISGNNPLLHCLSCGKKFCNQCDKKIIKQESFFDGNEKYNLEQFTPLCENCYKININKQMEKITMQRRFKQLRDTLPSKAEVWLATGERFRDSNLFYLAAKCFNEAIKLDKSITNKVVKIWEATGDNLIKKSRKVEAVQCYDEALLLNDDLGEIWLNRGKILEILKRIKEALASYNKVLKIDEKNIEALSRKGYLLAKQRDKAGAKTQFELALDINPNEEVIWSLKAQSHLLFGENKDAIDSSNKVLETNPNNEEALLTKCEGLIKLKNFPEAFKCSEKVLKLNSKSLNGLRCMGDALIGLGAIYIYNQAINLDPSGEQIDVQEIQEKIEKFQGETSKVDETTTIGSDDKAIITEKDETKQTEEAEMDVKEQEEAPVGKVELKEEDERLKIEDDEKGLEEKGEEEVKEKEEHRLEEGR
jgi:tetratricopeptide (TPR) repeat protein